MKKDKEWKTAFWMQYRHYKYTFRLFELKNASAIFQRLINNMIWEYLNDFMITYLNDILIYFNTLEKHWEHVQKMLKKLKEQQLYVKKLKSRFETQKVDFLKYVIQSDQIEKNSKKTKVIQDWSQPKKIKKVQTFLRLMNYYWKFILNYSQIAKPLTQLTQKNKSYHWEEEQNKAFLKLKTALMNIMHLRILKTACEKMLETDALNYVIGACLYQIEDSQSWSIVYRLQKLSRSKKRYEFHDKKLLIIVKALQKWRSYLISTEKSIQIYINHKNLRNFATIKQLNWQQICWVEQLIDYEFQIHYKKDNENRDINTLSQQSDHKKVKIIHQKILKKDNKKILIKSLVTTHHVKTVSQDDEKIIKECHKVRASEHLKVKQTENLIQQWHSLRNCWERVQQYIA